MKILYITYEFLAPDLALRIKNEGHDIAICMDAKTDILKGTLKRVPYATRLEYAKQCDLVIYDDKSKGEASRLIAQGGVELDGVKVEAPNCEVRSGAVLKVGKRRFLRLITG